MTKVKQVGSRGTAKANAISVGRFGKSIMSSAWFMAMQELFRPPSDPLKPTNTYTYPLYEGGRSKQYGQAHFRQNRRKDLKAKAKRRAKKHKHN